MPAKRLPNPAGARASGKAIAEAVATGDFVAALDRALLLWRKSRQAQVADLIDAIAAKCRPATIAAAGSGAKDSAAFQTAWTRLAVKPEAVMVGALAASIIKRVPLRDVGYVPDRDLERNKAFLDRIEALSKLPADPRVAAALIDIVEKAPFSESRRIYEPMMAVLEDIADDRVVAVLERLIERPSAKGSSIRDYFADALPETIKAIAEVERIALSADDAAAVTGLLERLGNKPVAVPHRDVEQLFAECLARPDDDAPRTVLADALLEREDPRGELIALQLRPGGEAEAKRVAALLRKHEKEWLGELGRVTKNRVWRRGFLDEAELQNHAVADDATWDRISRDPLLATVRVLRKGRANADIYRAFVRSPEMRALREVAVVVSEQLEDLITSSRSLDHVVVEARLSKGSIAQLRALADRGLARLTFTSHQAPSGLVDYLVKKMPLHTLFAELTVEPGRQVHRMWTEFLPTWFRSHAALAPVRRLGVVFSTTRVLAEAGKANPRIEIHAVSDYSVEWLLPLIGRFEHLVIRGKGPVEIRPGLATALAKIKPAMLELHDGWERQLTDRGRARRARRS